MKYIYTIAIIIASSLFCKAQKCNFNLNETDPESGILKKHILNSVTNQFIVWTNNDGGKYKLGLEITMPELRKESINKGDTLTLLIAGDEIIIAIADEKYMPVGKADDDIEATNYFPFYSVSAIDWARLCNANIAVFRVSFGKEFLSMEVPESKAKKIKQSIVCVK